MEKKEVYCHFAHQGELEINGYFDFRAPQPVSDDGGVPTWIYELLEHRPDIKQIALAYERGGAVYCRMPKKEDEK